MAPTYCDFRPSGRNGDWNLKKKKKNCYGKMIAPFLSQRLLSSLSFTSPTLGPPFPLMGPCPEGGKNGPIIIQFPCQTSGHTSTASSLLGWVACTFLFPYGPESWLDVSTHLHVSLSVSPCSMSVYLIVCQQTKVYYGELRVHTCFLMYIRRWEGCVWCPCISINLIVVNRKADSLWWVICTNAPDNWLDG